MFLLATAAICGGVSTLLGRDPVRTIGIVATIAALFLVGASYPAYKKHMDIYLERTEEMSGTIPGPESTGDRAAAFEDAPSDKVRSDAG
jgi:hypothetical protein